MDEWNKDYPTYAAHPFLAADSLSCYWEGGIILKKMYSNGFLLPKDIYCKLFLATCWIGGLLFGCFLFLRARKLSQWCIPCINFFGFSRERFFFFQLFHLMGSVIGVFMFPLGFLGILIFGHALVLEVSLCSNFWLQFPAFLLFPVAEIFAVVFCRKYRG